jgi:hypothetical protein
MVRRLLSLPLGPQGGDVQFIGLLDAVEFVVRPGRRGGHGWCSLRGVQRVVTAAGPA